MLTKQQQRLLWQKDRNWSDWQHRSAAKAHLLASPDWPSGVLLLCHFLGWYRDHAKEIGDWRERRASSRGLGVECSISSPSSPQIANQ